MIILDRNKKVPLYEQLYREIRQSILSGQLKKDDRLKPVRVMARELKISHNTVDRAYMQLLSEGYVRSVQGSGFYVEELFSIYTVPSRNKSASFSGNGESGDICVKWDFSCLSCENSQFPWNKWRKYLSDSITEQSYISCIRPQSDQGDQSLRECIRDYVNRTRAINCDASQIIIVPGFYYAMDIIMSILPMAHLRTAIEEPVSEDVKNFFRQKNLPVTAIPVKESGIDANILEKTDCNLVCVSPSHNFPTGITLSLARRVQLLEWSRRSNSYIIENDFGCEYTYKKESLLAIASMDRGNHVIYINDLSGVMSSQINCTYIILPEPLLRIYRENFMSFSFPQPLYIQKALAEFIRDGSYEAQSRKMSALSCRKLEIIKKVFSRSEAKVEVYPEAGGSYVLLEIKDFPDKELLLHQLFSRGIKLVSADKCYSFPDNSDNEYYIMGFGAVAEDELENACRFLEEAVMDIRKKFINTD